MFEKILIITIALEMYFLTCIYIGKTLKKLSVSHNNLEGN